MGGARAQVQNVLESGTVCGKNLPTMRLFDLLKMLREETILGLKIGLAVAIIFHLFP